MNSGLKLEEAEFFLELLDALDGRKSPLTYINDCAKEASFLFSAIMNSFYATIAIMKDEEGVDVTAFKKEHPEIYERANKGGERAKTVHVNHTLPAHSGYIPTTTLHLKRTPRLIEETKVPGKATLRLGNNYYMLIELRNELVEVNEFCRNHYVSLKKFHQQSHRAN